MNGSKETYPDIQLLPSVCDDIEFNRRLVVARLTGKLLWRTHTTPPRPGTRYDRKTACVKVTKVGGSGPKYKGVAMQSPDVQWVMLEANYVVNEYEIVEERSYDYACGLYMFKDITTYQYVGTALLTGVEEIELSEQPHIACIEFLLARLRWLEEQGDDHEYHTVY